MGLPINDPNDPSRYYKSPHSSLPIGSIRLQRREKRKRRLRYVTKSLFFGGSLGLIAITVVRFTTVDTQTVHETILNFYYFFFALVMTLSQLHVHIVVDKFRLLNYYWGKAIFSLFIGSLSCADSDEEFVQWLMASYFFVCALLMFILAYIDRAKDLE